MNDTTFDDEEFMSEIHREYEDDFEFDFVAGRSEYKEIFPDKNRNHRHTHDGSKPTVVFITGRGKMFGEYYSDSEYFCIYDKEGCYGKKIFEFYLKDLQDVVNLLAKFINFLVQQDKKKAD